MANPALTEDAVNAGAVAWVLTSTAFVFLMTAGLGFFYGGLVRDTNIINTMMMSVVSMGIVTLTWVVFGFSWAFGDNGPFIGNFDYSLWMDLDMKMWGDSGLPALVFAAFQLTFAIIASAIISGSLVERMRFSAYCIMLALWSLLIYAPLCHWVWGPGGWIGEMGALDFAGGTVVHISSGVSGLVAGGILGPRRHVEEEVGPANVPFVILGGCLLWFGWLGFNGGSALSVTDGVAARAVATTLVASASSMMVWLTLERVLKGKSTSVGASVGAVAGWGEFRFQHISIIFFPVFMVLWKPMTLRDCECSFLLAFFMLKEIRFPCFAHSCDLAATQKIQARIRMTVLFRSHGWFSAKFHTGHLQLLFASLSEKRWQKRLLFVILISYPGLLRTESFSATCQRQHEEASCASHQPPAL